VHGSFRGDVRTAGGSVGRRRTARSVPDPPPGRAPAAKAPGLGRPISLREGVKGHETVILRVHSHVKDHHGT